MTNTTSPIEAMFGMQRQYLTYGERLFEQTLDIQRSSAEMFMENSLAIQRNAQRQGVELFKNLVEAQSTAYQSAFDDDMVRSAVDRQLDTNAELSRQVLNAQIERGTDLIAQLVDGQFDAFQSAFDDDEVHSTVIQQLEEFSESQSDSWEAFEDEFRAAVDDLSVQQREVAARSVQAVIGAQKEIEEQSLGSTQQTQDAAKVAVESVSGAAGQQVDETEAEPEDTLEDIEGLGETYAKRLRENGIESSTHLAQANSETIAQAAEVNENEAEQWSERAQTQA